jgi:response regulator of citrate/malate metabolism
MYHNIILIDDDEAVLFYNKFILEQSEISQNILEAMDCASAIALLKELCSSSPNTSTSLILIDINMPQYNGFEFIENNRTVFEVLKSKGYLLIFHSTSCNPHDMKKIEDSDLIFSFVEKPLKIEGLTSLLMKAV